MELFRGIISCICFFEFYGMICRNYFVKLFCSITFYRIISREIILFKKLFQTENFI